MKITEVELRLLEELHHFGTPLDAAVLEEARAACRGLKISQTGNCAENVLYAPASGGIGILTSLEIENISNLVIPIMAVRLEMPGLDGDFHWLRRLSSREVREYGGYVLRASGPCGFDPAVVLNHRLVRDLKLCPHDLIEGFLLGEGTQSVPDAYKEGELIPMRLVIYTGKDAPFRAWVRLTVRREGQRRVDQKVQSRSLRTVRVMA